MQETFERANRAPWREGCAHQKQPVPISKSPARTGAIFTDLKGKRLNMRLGSEIKAAKDALAPLDIKREDFDADKNHGMTLGEWLYLGRYINLSDDQIRARPSINVPDVFPRKSDRPGR